MHQRAACCGVDDFAAFLLMSRAGAQATLADMTKSFIILCIKALHHVLSRTRSTNNTVCTNALSHDDLQLVIQ
jgi:hypothetical protein